MSKKSLSFLKNQRNNFYFFLYLFVRFALEKHQKKRYFLTKSKALQVLLIHEVMCMPENYSKCLEKLQIRLEKLRINLKKDIQKAKEDAVDDWMTNNFLITDMCSEQKISNEMQKMGEKLEEIASLFIKKKIGSLESTISVIEEETINNNEYKFIVDFVGKKIKEDELDITHSLHINNVKSKVEKTANDIVKKVTQRNNKININVAFIGMTGVGKSSLINKLANAYVTEVSDDYVHTTSEDKGFGNIAAAHSIKDMFIYDTVGFSQKTLNFKKIDEDILKWIENTSINYDVVALVVAEGKIEEDDIIDKVRTAIIKKNIEFILIVNKYNDFLDEDRDSDRNETIANKKKKLKEKYKLREDQIYYTYCLEIRNTKDNNDNTLRTIQKLKGAYKTDEFESKYSEISKKIYKKRKDESKKLIKILKSFSEKKTDIICRRIISNVTLKFANEISELVCCEIDDKIMLKLKKRIVGAVCQKKQVKEFRNKIADDFMKKIGEKFNEKIQNAKQNIITFIKKAVDTNTQKTIQNIEDEAKRGDKEALVSIGLLIHILKKNSASTDKDKFKQNMPYICNLLDNMLKLNVTENTLQEFCSKNFFSWGSSVVSSLSGATATYYLAGSVLLAGWPLVTGIATVGVGGGLLVRYYAPEAKLGKVLGKVIDKCRYLFFLDKKSVEGGVIATQGFTRYGEVINNFNQNDQEQKIIDSIDNIESYLLTELKDSKYFEDVQKNTKNEVENFSVNETFERIVKKQLEPTADKCFAEEIKQKIKLFVKTLVFSRTTEIIQQKQYKEVFKKEVKNQIQSQAAKEIEDEKQIRKQKEKEISESFKQDFNNINIGDYPNEGEMKEKELEVNKNENYFGGKQNILFPNNVSKNTENNSVDKNENKNNSDEPDFMKNALYNFEN